MNNFIFKKLNNEFLKINKKNIEYLFKIDTNRFSNFSILFKNKIIFDFSKNKINLYILNLLINLYNKNYLIKLINNKLNISISSIESLNNYLLNKRIIYKLNTLKKKIYNYILINNIINIIIISSNRNKSEFLLIKKYLYKFKNNNLLFFFINELNNNEIIFLKKIHLKKTLFIILYNNYYSDINIYNIIFYIKNNIIDVNNINYINNNILIISSKNSYLKFSIYTKNFIEIEDTYLNTYSNYYLDIILFLYLNNSEYNEYCKGFIDINNNFLYDTINSNIPILLSIIDFWNYYFFNININIFFSNFISNSFLDFYYNIVNIDNNYNKIFTLISSNIKEQNYIFNFLNIFNKRNIFFEFICSCNNNNYYLFKNNYDLHISNLLFKSKLISFNNINKSNKNNNVNIPNNFILLNNINSYTLGILIYFYKYRSLIRNLIIYKSNYFYKYNNYNNYEFINLYNENQEINYDTSTNNLINFYKKNRFI